MASIPSHSGSPTTRSVEISSHDFPSTGKGQRTPTVACLQVWTVGNHGNSVHIYQPASADPSINTVYSEGQISSTLVDVPQVQYCDDFVLTIAVAEHLPGYNISLGAELSQFAAYHLLPLSPLDCHSVV
jgi:hypothetical protein